MLFEALLLLHFFIHSIESLVFFSVQVMESCVGKSGEDAWSEQVEAAKEGQPVLFGDLEGDGCYTRLELKEVSEGYRW